MYTGKNLENDMKWHYIDNLMQWAYLFCLWFQVLLFIVILILHVEHDLTQISTQMWENAYYATQFWEWCFTI